MEMMQKMRLLERDKKSVTDYLEYRIDKFTFRIAEDRFYNGEGLWAKLENNQVRIGISDFLQQRSGDVAFAEIKPQGTAMAFGDEVAVIETIKVNISLTSPVSGRVIEVNLVMETAPEAINQDPYETGWLALIEATDWETDLARLLDPQAYFDKIKVEAEQEVKKG
jgi:glycine cleavage system H protein